MSVLKKVVIYQLVVRYFGNTNLANKYAGTIAENGCGKFNDINDDAINALKQLGVTHLWLTGCLRQATLTAYDALGLPADDPDIVKGRAGSFFAVRDYFDVCPDYANLPANRLDEFQSLIDRIHQAGMKVLMDFVPNHVARSYQSVVRSESNFGTDDNQTVFFSPSNHFFYLVERVSKALQLKRPNNWNLEDQLYDGLFASEDGKPNRVPRATGDAAWNSTTEKPSEKAWYEAVKLNYGFNYVDQTEHFNPIPRTWLLMDEIIAYWQAKGIDGFRCDMGQLIPHQAWEYLISHAKAPGRDPNAFFMAEAYPNDQSKEPIRDLWDLIDAGFDAVYHDNSYDRLKDIYYGRGQNGYDGEMVALSPAQRSWAVEYLENHDESRVSASIMQDGFGAMNVNYQLAPLQYLYSNGPVMLLNGQEVGEPGANLEGFESGEGRTTFFDYWCMPEFSKWVNNHAYDGGNLSSEQVALRKFLGDLLSLCQDTLVRAEGYWGLKYFNCNSRFSDCPDDLYSFARFTPQGSRLLVVAANFRPGATLQGRIRVPRELADETNLPQNVSVSLILDRSGRVNQAIANLTRDALINEGFLASISDQSSHVYVIQC